MVERNMMPKKTPAQLLKALESKNENIRINAALNPNATPEVLLKALKDEDWRVRRYAADNPNATPEVLMRAMRDCTVAVRYVAQERIEADPLLQLLIAALKGEDAAETEHPACGVSVASDSQIAPPKNGGT